VSEPNRESLEICEEIGSVFVTNYQKNMASTGLILQCSTPKILSGKPDLVKDPSNVRRASVSFGTPFGGLAVEVVVG
jgi:hypothetical protein